MSQADHSPKYFQNDLCKFNFLSYFSEGQKSIKNDKTVPFLSLIDGDGATEFGLILERDDRHFSSVIGILKLPFDTES